MPEWLSSTRTRRQFCGGWGRHPFSDRFDTNNAIDYVVNSSVIINIHQLHIMVFSENSIYPNHKDCQDITVLIAPIL